MRKLLIITFLLFLTGCSREETKELNVLNWSSYIPDSVIQAFEKETNIKVNYGTYSSNEECLAKISNTKLGTYDLVFPSDYMVEIMISRDLLQPIDRFRLTNFQNLNPVYLNLDYDPKNEYSIPFIAASTVISVNREFIQDEITSYNDLLNPKYENEIVLIEDQRIIIGLALLANGFDMNSTDERELEIAKDWLLKLKPNIKAYDSDSPKNFLITKEASIGILWNAEAALAKMENPNIENIFPEEGIALSIDNFTLLKGAKNVDEAYQFIDYILREDVMKEIILSYPYKNVNLKTEELLDSSYLENEAANFSDSYITKGKFVKNIGSSIKLYDRIWALIK